MRAKPNAKQSETIVSIRSCCCADRTVAFDLIS